MKATLWCMRRIPKRICAKRNGIVHTHVIIRTNRSSG
ncbi:Uncharacterised protein [Vibrio cholerae]|nr:Uncharacterised protein [Vibrio cholerae]